jgi:hypothetical protein
MAAGCGKRQEGAPQMPQAFHATERGCAKGWGRDTERAYQYAHAFVEPPMVQDWPVRRFVVR